MKKITIIGSGGSGIILLMNLIKNHKKEKIVINLLEKDKDKFITGIAYSTKEKTHLLNVRVAGMSIFKDNPDHFYEWLITNNYNYNKTDFVPRYIFGEYLKYYYDFYIKSKSDDITINILFNEVIDVKPNEDKKYDILLDNGESIESNIVVLALGHISISEINTLKYKNLKNYHRSPWSSDIFKDIDQNDDVFLIGSGLTSDDIILSLLDRNHTGNIYAISRKGKHPIEHKIYEPYIDFYDEIKNKDLNTIFSIVKNHIYSSKNPHGVIDSLRPHTQKIWKNFTYEDKSRFIRHVNGLWNIIRHRTPEINKTKIDELVTNKRLTFLTGNIIDMFETDNNKINLDYYNKNKKLNEKITVNHVINCIGPESSYKHIKMPLIKNLLKNKIIEHNDIGISIKVANWEVVSNNIPQKGLLAIGPILKGELFESTAIPEIKVQSEDLSIFILNNI